MIHIVVHYYPWFIVYQWNKESKSKIVEQNSQESVFCIANRSVFLGPSNFNGSITQSSAFQFRRVSSPY